MARGDAAEPLPRPAGVLFDAGGTLVEVHTDRLAAQLRSRGHDPRRLDDAFWSTLVLLDSEFGPAAGEWYGWFPEWLERFGAACGVPTDVMREAWHAADDELHLWDRPVEGAAEALTRLREAGLRVGVVSNSDGRAGEALARAGLADLCEVVVDSGVVGVAKPDPAIFAHALGPLGLEAESTWYLGDTVTYDAAGAEAAGMTSWVIDHRGLHTVAHPRRVRTLAEFVDVALGSRGNAP